MLATPASRFAVGEVVWAHTGLESSFEKGVVERLDGHKNTVQIKVKGGLVDIKESDVHKTNVEKQDGLPDNTYLRELNEATLLHNVRTRYNDTKDDGGCYSSTGHILIAVNPFRSLKIYEEANVRRCLVASAPLRARATHALRVAKLSPGGRRSALSFRARAKCRTPACCPPICLGAASRHAIAPARRVRRVRAASEQDGNKLRRRSSGHMLSALAPTPPNSLRLLRAASPSFL